MKKQTLSQLKLRDISESNQQEENHAGDFSDFEGRFKVVMKQLSHRKDQYEALKSLTTDKIVDLYTIEDFKELSVRFQKSLEMAFPPGHELDEALLVKFH